MLLSVFAESPARWRTGDPIGLELNGELLRTTVQSVGTSPGGLWLQMDVPVPVGTAARVGRFARPS